jgi:large subunit ribosomal protein L29
MALPKIAEARELSDAELSEAIVATKRQLFDFRFQTATKQLTTNHEIKHAKHRLAQLLTVERERQPSGKSRKSKKKAAAQAATPQPLAPQPSA